MEGNRLPAVLSALGRHTWLAATCAAIVQTSTVTCSAGNVQRARVPAPRRPPGLSLPEGQPQSFRVLRSLLPAAVSKGGSEKAVPSDLRGFDDFLDLATYRADVVSKGVDDPI
jgi:hypothetical protein